MLAAPRRVTTAVVTALGALFVSAAFGYAVSGAGGAISRSSASELWLAAAGAMVIAAGGVALILASPSVQAEPSRGAEWWVVAAAVVFSLAAQGVGNYTVRGIAGHQFLWAMTGAWVLALVALGRWRRSMPPWLVLIAAAVCAVAALAPTVDAAKDAALVSIALLVMWHVAATFSAGGGVLRFLRMVARAYWLLLGVGVAIAYGHVSVLALSPDTTQLPWEGGLQSWVQGNYLGYGAITVQGGREIGSMVAVYYLVLWRRDRRLVDLTLFAAALLITATAYGRVPFIGAALAIIIVSAAGMNRGLLAIRGTFLVGVFAALALWPGFTASLHDKLTERREGATSFDSGHLSLWAQHANLFARHPVVGVGPSPPRSVVAAAAVDSAIQIPTGRSDMPVDVRIEKGPRGEGGWTGLFAQRGALGGGLILAVVVAAGLRAFRRDRVFDEWDTLALRGLIPATVLWYLTDTPPLGGNVYSAVLTTILTLIAVAQLTRRQRPAT